MEENTLYHYAVKEDMEIYVKEQSISFSHVYISKPNDFFPLILLSGNPDLDHAAMEVLDNQFIYSERFLMIEGAMLGGIYRIEVKSMPPLIPFHALEGLEQFDEPRYSTDANLWINYPADVFVTNREIPASEWVSVHKYNGKKWKKVLVLGLEFEK